MKRAAMSSATSAKKINLCDQAHLEVQEPPKGRVYQQLKESMPSAIIDNIRGDGNCFFFFQSDIKGHLSH